VLFGIMWITARVLSTQEAKCIAWPEVNLFGLRWQDWLLALCARGRRGASANQGGSMKLCKLDLAARMSA
jgi:hypothetical protein